MRTRSEVEPRFTYRVVECAHDMMITEPALPRDLLLEEVDASSQRAIGEKPEATFA